ncbi:MAG: glycerol-3-phosphate 1-O-acyltransferase PlsY [Lentisphaeria bacterium]|nr:glycerol-3-phosphate 1-O-acyltransferase PlsY [Lentisphaeria bacterium]
MATLIFILTVLLAYLVGSIPFGLLIGKLNGKDIRKEGSCNIGATNVTRVVGKWWGKLCFLCDFLKGFLPVFIVMRVYPDEGLLIALTALAAMIGHIFPVYLGFKGGKGVSTAAGAALALCPAAVVFAGVVWVAVFLTSRYVSLASLAAALALPVLAWLLKFVADVPLPLPVGILLILFAVLTFWRHRSNIERLANGTESRFERKK